jgi:DNA mismatch repair protein MutL
MGQIQILPELLVNKIAAGEVIERPASVVKELLENAIDSGAQRIDVAVEDGGKRLIQVTDNGSGMSSDDVGLTWTAHATSKIKTGQDLFAINTMGFRGEALASIASVSRARIVSRTVRQQEGYELSREGTTHTKPRPTAAAVGTTVWVRDLFFNVPARRKFLKGSTTEMSHISEQLTRIALAQSQVHFTLSHNSRKALDLPPASNLRERIASLFGDELAQTLIEVNSDERRIKIQALLAPPDMSRASGKWQYFFLNGRYIRDRFIQHALREAYRGLTEANRFPVAFLYLQMDPELVDVNVHPTKVEVRFVNSNSVHSQVLGTLREQFLKSDLRSRMHIDSGEDPQGQQVCQAVADYLKSSPPPTQPPLSFGSRGPSYPQPSRSSGPSGQELREELDKLFEADRQSSSSPTQSAQAVPTTRPTVMQVHKTYLVAETQEGLIIVDQHALHERVLYEQLRQRLCQGHIVSQQLLVPMPVELTNQQRAKLEQIKEVLAKVGIVLVDFGPESVAVQSFPAILDRADPAAAVQDIVDRLAEMPTDSASEQVLEEVLQSMACKAAVKAGDKLSDQEMTHLLADGQLTPTSSNCPHGRPTILKMSLAELEKQFKRT